MSRRVPQIATTGFFFGKRRIASYMASPPVVVPPGLLMSRMTALTCSAFANRSKSSLHLLVFGDDAVHRHPGDMRQEASGASEVALTDSQDAR